MTATDTELDQHTRDELRPPCEIDCGCGRDACHAQPVPADWIVRTYVNAERIHTMLMCDAHLAFSRAVAADIVTVTSEPLR